MNRAYVLLASLILIATPMAGCLSGEDLEEIVDDVLGCMDENAANYEENATAELVGDCIYMATTETFIEAMTDMGSIEDMLEESPKAGYSQSISSSEWNQDLGMQMDVQIEDIVMADLENDSVYVHNSISIVGLLQMEYTHVQVGEVVNVHLLVGGMMVQGEATTGSYQTRDATPNVLEVIAEQGGLFNEGGLFNDGADDDGDDDDGDLPEDAVITITMSDDMETQTMTMEYTEGGAEITMTIHIDQNQDLMSMSMETENGSATSSITYEVMWGDAIVIEVDETLPKTSIPVWLDFAGEDEFVCGSGETIPMDWVDDGYPDCEDGSDESDNHDHDDHGDDDHNDHHDDGNHISWYSYHDGYCEWEGYSDATDAGEDSRWWCKISQDDEDWENWWYYCEHHDSDWHCTDDFGQSEEFEHSADGDEWSGSEDGEDGHDDDGDDDYAFYCSNDGEDYAESMGGILCPEGPGVTPECPDGEYCVCIDVDGSCDDGDDDWGYYADDDDGGPNFIESSTLHCNRMMDTSMVQNDAADEWDGTNLDMSDCGGEPTEYYNDYVVGDTPVTAPYSITIIVSEEGWSEMTGDNTGDLCVSEGGIYDSDNDVCGLTFEGFRNDTHLQEPIHDWIDQSGAYDAEEAEMYCSDWVGGSYDADNDICLEPAGEIIEADGGALFINDGDEFFSFYFLDESTGSGFLAEIETSYGLLCDNGQVVHEHAYDDGWEDCDDGSDEPYQGEETSEFECSDGTLIPFSWVNNWRYDCPDGSDEASFYQSTDNGDDNNEQPDTLPPVNTGFVAENQTLNAPITDFEVHFLSDCEEEYDEEEDQMIQPDLSACTNEFSIPLTGGEAEGVTITYTDHDGDGLVSPGDEMSVEWGDYDGEEIDKMEIYDTYASQYSSESAAMPPVLPGFGAILGALALLGAAIASRRD